jgi:predicted RND superfamily exporter protein
MSLRDRIEAGFESWADCVLRYRRFVVVASLVLVAGLSAGLPRLELETSFESYLPRDNPAQQLYQRFRRQFGSGERVVVLLRPPELYETGFLEELRTLHFALERELPYLDRISSLVDARHLVDTPDGLLSEGLLDDPPRSAADLSRLRRRVRANPLYQNVIVAADESATALVVELDGALGDLPSGSAAAPEHAADLLEGFEDEPIGVAASRGEMLTTEQSRHLVRVLDEILAAHAPSSALLFVAGTPLLAHRLGEMLTRDIVMFVSASLLLTALLLFLLFRSVWATIHPLLVVGLSLLGTLGWMGFAGVPLTAVTEILPSLLVAIGVGDAVHIQSMFYKHREGGHDVHASIRWAMGHSGLAVLLTSLTTAASMAAFQAAELQPVIDLGRAAPVGVALALLFSITLLPVLLSLTPMDSRSSHASRRATARRVDALLLRLGRTGTRRPQTVLAAVVLLWIAAGSGVVALHFSQDDLRWLPEDDSLRVATEELNRSMRGAEPLELLVELEPGLDLREPAVLEALREIESRVVALRVGEVEVGQSLSLVDIVEETHRVLGDDPEAPLELPRSRTAISQELLLFEGAAPEDLERLADAALRTTRIVLTVPFVDALHYPRFSRAVVDIALQVLEERGLRDGVKVAPTGLLMLAGETFELLFVSMARSYAIAFGVIAVLMLVLIGQLRLGLLSTLPNLTPILLVLGLMGWLGAALDVSTMLVGGILIGVVVDDTIHFVHNFVRYRSQSGCALLAIRQTLATTGRAMLVTSIVLSIGFFTFLGASLSNVEDFGLLCGLGVILAFLADIVMLPALVAVAAPCAPDCSAHEHEAVGLAGARAAAPVFGPISSTRSQ